MNTYAIVRRGICTPDELPQVDARSRAELERRSGQVRKIRSYLLTEPDGRVGTICIYQATGPEAIHEHGRAARVAVDEVIPLAAIDVQRPDPESVTA
jgi:hypothetical protein